MGYAINFCYARNIPAEPTLRRQYFFDWIQPGVFARPMLDIPIPTNPAATAVYGRFYYEDIFGAHYSSGFINEINSQRIACPYLAPASYTDDRDES